MKRLLALILLCAPMAGAQLPDKPQPTVRIGIDDARGSTEWVNATVPHRTSDRAYVSLNVAGAALTATDLALGFSNHRRELNPLVRNKAALGTSAAVEFGAWYLSHRYKRQEDAAAAIGVRRPAVKWWWFPMAPIVAHGIPLIVNLTRV